MVFSRVLIKYVKKTYKNIILFLRERYIRIPFVPGFNSDQIEKIGELLSGLRGLTGVRVLPYHNYAGTKYTSLDMENTLSAHMPTCEEMQSAKNQLKSFGIKVLE